ncbi:MAG: hypothetical protein K2Z25_00410 [Beijerinckiaceae bacterium]|nr:hypothetical protein [Beijerinckiaceae bacterium]
MADPGERSKVSHSGYAIASDTRAMEDRAPASTRAVLEAPEMHDKTKDEEPSAFATLMSPLGIGLVLIALGIAILQPWNFVGFRFALGGLLIGAGVRALLFWLDAQSAGSQDPESGTSSAAADDALQIPLQLSIAASAIASPAAPDFEFDDRRAGEVSAKSAY